MPPASLAAAHWCIPTPPPPRLQDVGGCGVKNSVSHALLRPPRVFTLQLGWSSHREDPHSIARTLAAVDETVSTGWGRCLCRSVRS